MRFPCGFRFDPTDEELVGYYLKRKIDNKELKYLPIHDVPLYEMHPEELIEKYETDGDQAWYFFTSRNRRYPKGRWPSRSTKEGYWRTTGPDTHIMDQTCAEIGLRKSLVFYEGKQGKDKQGKDNGNKTPLMMHEYRIPEAQLDDWVVCKIYYNRKDDRSSTKKNSKPRQKKDNNCSSVRHQPLNKSPSPVNQTEPLHTKFDNPQFAAAQKFNLSPVNQTLDPQLPSQGTFTQEQLPFTQEQLPNNLTEPFHEPSSFDYNNPIMQFPDIYFNPLDNINNIGDPSSFLSGDMWYFDDGILSYIDDLPNLPSFK